MAHKKAGGSTNNGRDSESKRLGVKRYGGENVVAGWSVAPISVLFVLFIFLIEILVAFLQAYIFTLLSAVFIGLAVKEEDH